MADLTKCAGCGSAVGRDGECPQPTHCDACPPWTCDDCGGMDSMDNPCACWVSLGDLCLADLKGVLALGGLNVGTNG